MAAFLIPPSSDFASPVGGRSQIDLQGDDNVVYANGADTIYAGNGFDQVYGADFDTEIYGDSGFLYVKEGNGDNYVDLGYGRGEVFGGLGRDTLIGGGAGNSYLVANGGDDLLISRNADISYGSSGDTEFVGSQTGFDTMVGGTGRNLFFQTGEGVAFTGPGASTVVGGSGGNTVFFESGSALAYTGGGPTDYILQKGASGGSDAIVDFRPGFDRVVLDGYSSAEIGRAVATVQHGGYGSTLSFSDGTDLTLFNVQDVGRAIA